MKVIKNKVLVTSLHDDEKNEYTTNSGILVKNSLRPKNRLIRAKVEAVGSGIRSNGKLIPMSEIVNVGDTILYYMPSAQVVTIDNKEYTIIRAEDIDAVIYE